MRGLSDTAMTYRFTGGGPLDGENVTVFDGAAVPVTVWPVTRDGERVPHAWYEWVGEEGGGEGKVVAVMEWRGEK